MSVIPSKSKKPQPPRMWHGLDQQSEEIRKLRAQPIFPVEMTTNVFLRRLCMNTTPKKKR